MYNDVNYFVNMKTWEIRSNNSIQLQEDFSDFSRYIFLLESPACATLKPCGGLLGWAELIVAEFDEFNGFCVFEIEFEFEIQRFLEFGSSAAEIAISLKI